MRHPPLLSVHQSQTTPTWQNLAHHWYIVHVQTPLTTNWLTWEPIVALLGLISMSFTSLCAKSTSWALTTMNSVVWMLLLPLLLQPIMTRLLACSMNMITLERALQFIPLLRWNGVKFLFMVSPLRLEVPNTYRDFMDMPFHSLCRMALHI